MDTRVHIIIKILIPDTYRILYPDYLNPYNADNGEKHHENKPDEFFSAHAANLTYHIRKHVRFNFSLTLINLKLTALYNL